ncbi:MAG: PQQ-binding-like beta-propeller repeat protein [Planctomycetales bacterium]|nr:PQQ-binding-like beta-propeller repeat protein [Planctomycetales bacterium]
MQQGAFVRLSLSVALVGLVAWTTAGPLCLAEQIVNQAKAQVEAVEEQQADGEKAKDPEGEEIEAEFPGGAGLKTDPELEALLKRADLFIGDGRLDLAAILWQRTLDDSGQVVMTRPEWVSRSFDGRYRKYKSLSEEIERTIANLAEDGLRQYRLSADGDAQAVLAAAQPGEREAALTDIVRKYFMSSIGDDAAYELACLRIDRHDFVGAARLLSHILTDHPDPSVPRGEMLLRLALANARVGDAAAAKSAVAEFERLGAPGALARLAELLKSELELGVAAASASPTDQWPMPFGGPQRVGHMPALPAAATGATQTELWTDDFLSSGSQISGVSPEMKQQMVMLGGVMFGRGTSSRMSTNQAPMSRESVLARWRAGGWMPSGNVLFRDGLLYYKRHDRVVCLNAETGALEWHSRPSVYQPSALPQYLANLRRVYGQSVSTGAEPSTPIEYVVFSDRLHHAMTLDGDLLYTIDGPIEGEPRPTASQAQMRNPYGFQSSPSRARANFLSAYDARNGKFKWIRAADGSEVGTRFDVGYMAEPTPYGKFLLLPVNDNGSLWLQALSKADGALVWKSFLCEEPNSGASPSAAVGVTVDGGDAYVATGCGAVFAVDAMSGAIRWAVRYQRDVAVSSTPNRFNGRIPAARKVDGWDDDLMFPFGKALVIFASDSDKLFALDRRSGELLWESPRRPASEDDEGRYCLGLWGESVYVGGRKSVRCYDLNRDGRLIWEVSLDGSFGRGVLTDDSIYLPDGDTILRINPANGKRLAQVGVFSPSKEPVGSLFTDGKRFLTLGMGRVYALQDLDTRLAELAARIERGDGEAQLERMRLRLRGGDFEAALADLRGAFTLKLAGPDADDAIDSFHFSIGEAELIDRDPKLTLTLLLDAQTRYEAAVAERSSAAPPQADRLARRDAIAVGAMRKIAADKIGGSIDLICSLAGWFGNEAVRRAANDAALATADAGDADRLQQALTDDNEHLRDLAVRTIGKTLTAEQAAPLLLARMEDAAPSVQYSAAVALANQGDRRSLAALGKLLECDSLTLRVASNRALRALTGQRFKFVAYEKPEVRTEQARAWQTWIAGDGAAAELYFPLDYSRASAGRLLVAMHSQGRVEEFDAERNNVWEVSAPGVWGVEGLPDGHRLISSNSGKFVAEYDENGKEVWRKNNLPGNISHAHRLENGNTLVTCANVQEIWEISPAGETVWKVKAQGYPQDARRLDDGNTLVALQQAHKVVELDRDGKTVWEVQNLRGVFSARRLDNGNTLAAVSAQGEVVEIDRDKNIVWRHRGLSSPYDAVRLDSGNTVIADSQGVREIDPDGKTVWQRQASGLSRVDQY